MIVFLSSERLPPSLSGEKILAAKCSFNSTAVSPPVISSIKAEQASRILLKLPRILLFPLSY